MRRMRRDAAPSDSRTTPLRVHGALLVVTLLFGANYVVAKVVLREVSPLDLVVIRTWGAAAMLFAGARLRRRPARGPGFTPRDVVQLFLFSLLGVSINQLCFLGGLARSTATNAAVMLVTIPLLTLAFAVALRRERPSAMGIAGIALGLVGAAILIGSHGGVDLTSRATAGNLLLLGSGSSYALYLVLTRPILARHDPLRVTSWVFLLAALTVTPIGIGGVRGLVASGLSGAGWAGVAYVVIGATAVPYLLNNWALVRVKSSVVAVYILLQPVVAGALGRVFLHEAIGPHTAIAALLVVTGVLLSGWRRG
jgi:drug/metabolite transporter (DMT)-like permease